MAGNQKRVGKKLRAIEAAFCEIPAKHRVKPVFQALAKVSGVKPERAEEHFRLGLALMEAVSAGVNS